MAEGLRKLLEDAGCPREEVPEFLRAFREGDPRVESRSDLREKLRNNEAELADYGITKASWKKRFKDLVMQEAKCDHLLCDIRASHQLSELAYHEKNDAAFQMFKQDFKPLFLDQLQCPSTGQKYVVAVLHRRRRSLNGGEEVSAILFVAFAGTHTASDWKCNLNAGPTACPSVGGDAHSGFLLRASHVKFDGLKRIATAYECHVVVFAGHSLGAAVADLAALTALNRTHFSDKQVLGIGFGAPMCVGKSLVQHMDVERWTKAFVTVVNKGDPVPGVLNVADTTQQLVSDGSEICMGVLTTLADVSAALALVLPEAQYVERVASAGQQLVRRLQDLGSSSLKGSVLQRLQEAYVPLGVYAFVDTRTSRDGTEYVVELDSGADCKQKLDASRLLTPQGLDGVLNQNGMLKHGLPKYRSAISSPAFQDKIQPSDWQYGGGEQVTPASVHFELTSAQYVLGPCGTLTLHITGRGLDFLGGSTIKINGVTVTGLQWTVLHCSEATFVAVTAFSGELPQQVSVSVTPDTQPTAAEINADRLQEDSGHENQLQLNFDENFLETMVKLAWIRRNLMGTPDTANSALVALDKLDELAGPDLVAQPVVTGRHVSTTTIPRTFRASLAAVRDDRSLHSVGVDSSSREHQQHVLKFFCPEDGHVLKTQDHVASQVIIGLVAVAATAGILCSGGLGLVGPLLGFGAGVSATGGYGTGLVILAFGSAGAYCMYSRVKGQYNALLHDLHTWTGSKTWDQTRSGKALTGQEEASMERRLMRAVVLNRESGKQDFPGPGYFPATPASQEKLGKLYQGVLCVRALKEAAGSQIVIGISGPQKAGKSLLSSFLMMDPRIAQRDSSLSRRTTESPPHVLTDRVLLMDSPAVTSIERDVRDRYFNGAYRVAAISVYVRQFHATSEAQDAEDIFKILFGSHQMSPPLLICLSQVRNLRKDGTTGRYHDAQEMRNIKADFFHRVKEHARSQQGESGFAAFGSAFFEKKWKNVDIVFSDVLDDPPPADAPAELRNFLQNDVYGAKEIGQWLQQKIDPHGQDADLTTKINAIDRAEWDRKNAALPSPHPSPATSLA